MNKQVLAIVVLTFSSITLAHSDVNVTLAADANVLTQESIKALVNLTHKNAAFSTSEEIMAYGKNSEIAQAFADKIKAESAIKLSRNAVDVANNNFQNKVTTGIWTTVAVFVTVVGIITFIEWYNQFRKNYTATTLEIESIKVKIAEEKAKQITLKKAQVAFA